MSTYKDRIAAGLCGRCGKPSGGKAQCEDCRQRDRDRKQAKYDRNREAKACLQCGKPAEEGKTRCTECLAYQNGQQKTVAQRRKAVGLCQTCGKPAAEGLTVCQGCSDRAGEAALRRYYRNKEAGVCRYCGSDSGGKARCEACQAAIDDYQKAWYEKRKASGLCLYCDNPARPGLTSCTACGEHKQELGRQRWMQLKLDALQAYGGPVCSGCGEDNFLILEIDHVNGGGNKHRKEIGQTNTYLWLKQNDYPVGFRVLCPTCNKKAHMRIPLPSETQT